MSVFSFLNSKRSEMVAVTGPTPIPTTLLTLDELFDEVKRHGALIVHGFADNTWSATCTLPVVNTPGAEFKVMSGYGHKTPHAAISQVLNNIRQGQGK